MTGAHRPGQETPRAATFPVSVATPSRDASMLALANPKDEPHLLSDRDHSRVVVPRYHEDLSTAYNYTCLLVAFRDAVVGEFWLTIIACVSGIHSSIPSYS